jgi:tetratricopeptide (TPR) repeat protein
VIFPLLKAFFGEAFLCQWVEPREEPEGMISRLLGLNLDPETATCFAEGFSKTSCDRFDAPVDSARQCAKIGRLDMALSHYGAALRSQPNNWVLMNEVAHFLSSSLGDCKGGANIAKAAINANPTCSSDLWNTLGDCLFAWSRIQEAKQAYLRALQINENDVRARLNMAWVHNHQKDYAAALKMIAEGLALDHMGQYHDTLLQKQQEVLQRLTLKQQQDRLRAANRISMTAPMPSEKQMATQQAPC